MTRVEAKELLPIIRAYSEGKTVEYFKDGEWTELKYPQFSGCFDKYRIKPDPKYRPFKNGDECREEMKKHEPFGWIQNKSSSDIMCISMVYTNCVCFGPNYQCTYYGAFYSYTFVDGEPFGIKEG